MSDVITQQALVSLMDAWLGQGQRVIAPTRVKDDVCLYEALSTGAQACFDGFIHPRNSIKEFFFPRHEKLYTYKFKGQKLELEDAPAPDAPFIIVGARPCDAASLPVLDHVFNWDYVDEFYAQRRKAGVVISLACTAHDAQCFCTSMGLGPASEPGSDAMLLPLGDGAFEVRCLTEKGSALFAGKTTASDKTAQLPAGLEASVDVPAVQAFLQGAFDHPIWQEIALRCLGCGACAFSCPTCHCFDIVDEGAAHGGQRVKNWDCCQFGMFTLHASGHNPRSVQSQRQRQRVLHKFQIYPEKFGALLCTGCGNCTRNCPVGLGVLTTLRTISQAALSETKEVGAK